MHTTSGKATGCAEPLHCFHTHCMQATAPLASLRSGRREAVARCPSAPSREGTEPTAQPPRRISYTLKAQSEAGPTARQDLREGYDTQLRLPERHEGGSAQAAARNDAVENCVVGRPDRERFGEYDVCSSSSEGSRFCDPAEPTRTSPSSSAAAMLGEYIPLRLNSSASIGTARGAEFNGERVGVLCVPVARSLSPAPVSTDAGFGYGTCDAPLRDEL